MHPALSFATSAPAVGRLAAVATSSTRRQRRFALVTSTRRSAFPVTMTTTGPVRPSSTEWGHPRGAALKRLAGDQVPLSATELDEVLGALREAAAGDDAATVVAGDDSVDWDGLRALLATAGHRPHKDWAATGAAAATARACLLRGRRVDDPRSGAFRRMWARVLGEGNWGGAVEAAAASGRDGAADTRPWAVLVTGVNGIRKTTSLYQPWFPSLLATSLAAAGHSPVDASRLPVGGTSWFRQLDHLVATVGAAEFRRLYAGAAGASPPVDAYAAHKDGIFARYRTVAEVLGMALVLEAAATGSGLNVLVETSGRDIAMFHYVNAVFPADGYRKLALHFTVNTLDAAAASVSARMAAEMGAGTAAAAGGGGIHALIAANAGGPYGPDALPGVQADAERVWGEVTGAARRGEGAAVGWWTASVTVEAALGPDGWSATAASPGGSR
ncbi:hypothetical protein BU14_0453s0005 [Porphyra umbilicalis]|uniref:Uncharacterized protein n=1 Tax=Porphyra umbilicalis TaxID=2786 RepID=A0A1X6NUD4_PORUM|nr:hypothetical protein BU14_0453s0005 [Porphyra umbilicalis]|eukprot:OSX72239.1 hypothetical protein BU14_0453s0005 [Porphyra umbilicalis]